MQSHSMGIPKCAPPLHARQRRRGATMRFLTLTTKRKRSVGNGVTLATVLLAFPTLISANPSDDGPGQGLPTTENVPSAECTSQGPVRSSRMTRPTDGRDRHSCVYVTPSAREGSPTGHTLPLPPPNARGGGPLAPSNNCAGADRASNGQCVAPDLSPNAPQREWSQDPSGPSETHQAPPDPGLPNTGSDPNTMR
jgi:hypothetical protein